MSHDKGNTFRVIKKVLEEDLGYHITFEVDATAPTGTISFVCFAAIAPSACWGDGVQYVRTCGPGRRRGVADRQRQEPPPARRLLRLQVLE